jgi:chemotaxis protein methyltransferase CheR
MTLAITSEEMPVWSRYIQEITGIQLDDSKRYLIETRLGFLLAELGATNYSELFYKVRADATNKLRSRVIEAITTNETSFFRDQAPFEMLRHKIIPDLIDRRNRSGMKAPIRVWSAACSTGQEAYSTAIVFKELLGDLSRYDIRILGTDISNKVVAQASYGEYSRLELDRGLPQETLTRHFSSSGERWRVRDEIRSLVTFRTMNLLEPYSFPHQFDIAFCRNVAIYFNEPDKIKLFRNIARHLAKDGALIIGSTESITGLCPELEPKRHLRSVYYQWKAPV